VVRLIVGVVCVFVWVTCLSVCRVGFWHEGYHRITSTSVLGPYLKDRSNREPKWSRTEWFSHFGS